MLDVPRVFDWIAVFCLEPYRAGPGDVSDPVGAFPHGRELVEALPGEYPPQDEIADFEGA